MTVETKTTIQASDIATVEFECVQCHSVMSWPLAVASRPPTHCHCLPERQWMTVGGDTYRAIVEPIERMRQFGETKNEPFILRFGLRGAAILAPASDSKA
jgi:hypothetical protein